MVNRWLKEQTIVKIGEIKEKKIIIYPGRINLLFPEDRYGREKGKEEGKSKRPVSYTHLDVYKRQAYRCIQPGVIKIIAGKGKSCFGIIESASYA